MIRSFACEDTHHLFTIRKNRRWSNIREGALRKLDQLQAAALLTDLAVPAGNRLEALSPPRKGQHSIRINQQWRICFIWQPDGPHEVEIVDYHERRRGVTVIIKQPANGWNIQGVATHPGEILREDFLRPLGLTANALASRTRMPATRIGEILHERRAVSTDTALRLARFFGTSAEFWINLQAAHDLSKARLELGKTIQKEVAPINLPSISA